VTAPVLLEVENLSVRFETPDGVVEAVNGLSFQLAAGETLGVVGESGSGKSQTALAILGLLADNARVTGRIRFDGVDLLALKPRARAAIRGRRIGMVFQDPMTSLNPYRRIGLQMAEVLEHHQGASRKAALAEARRMLDAVQVPDAAQKLAAYPHQLSGGQRQRVMMAMTLLTRPPLLLADEPTTALDVTVQAGLLALLAELRREFGIAILLITHDLGVVARLCDRTLVLYGGQCMELGTTSSLIHEPRHPYTAGLLAARPQLVGDRSQPLLALPGQPPDLTRLPTGCPFTARCPEADVACQRERPALRAVGDRALACHRR
jgi:oligopeptide transport system ATP-binding protein